MQGRSDPVACEIATPWRKFYGDNEFRKQRHTGFVNTLTA
jgi:hypothetical protein